ncbi:MAG: ferrochelatase [Leptospirales bacterium]
MGNSETIPMRSLKNEEKAILLINTGSPNSINTGDVASYLRQFLMDKRVIDIPWVFRSLLVRVIIVPFRAKKSAAFYKKIWTNSGSPLKSETQKLASLVEKKTKFQTAMAMRYGNPSISQTVKELYSQGIRQVFAVPMFPHYAMSTYESVVEEFKSVCQKFSNLSVDIKEPYFENAQYLNAIIANAKPFVTKKFDHILFTYHSLPNRHLVKTDPTKNHCLQKENCCHIESEAFVYCYKAQTYRTTLKLAEKLKLKEGQYSISYQSAMRGEWIGPSTESVLTQIPKKGVKSLVVIAPGFVTDNLETLEELQIRGKDYFLNAGGKKYTFVPCLNSTTPWVNAISQWAGEVL